MGSEQSDGGFSREGFAQFGMRAVGVVIIEEAEDGAPDERQVGDEVRIVAAGFVFAPERIAAPVIAVLDATPVTSDEIDPVFGTAFARFLAGQIEAPLGGGHARVFDRALALNAHEGAGKRKMDGHRLDRPKDQAALVDASVTEIGLEQRGGCPWHKVRA